MAPDPEPTDAEKREARNGLRMGKLGFEASRAPYDPKDRSARARAWRRGWTAGNAAFRKATEGESDA